MRYSIHIDQVTALKWGLSINQAFVYDYLYGLSSWADNIQMDGEVFYFASKNKTVQELPMITTKTDTIYRYYKNLESLGLIQLKKVDNKDYIRLVKTYAKQWNSFRELGQPSEETRTAIRRNSDSHPTNNTTSNNSINIPTWDEFKSYALENKPNVNVDDLELKYKSWVAGGWKTGTGRKIKNWKSTLLNTLPHIKEVEQKGGESLSFEWGKKK